MNNRNKKTSKRKLLLAVSAAAILAIAYLVYSYSFDGIWPFSSNKDSGITTTTESSDTKSSANNQASDEAKNPNKTPVQYESSGSGSVQSSPSLTGVISYKSINNGTLSIRLIINQVLTQGSCKLTLRNHSPGKVVQTQADIITNPSSSTCKGFDTPISNLSSGNWDITVEIVSGNRNGTITGQVSI